MTCTDDIIAHAAALTARREASEAVRRAQAGKCTQAYHKAIQRAAKATHAALRWELSE